jgi:hypothetical protein
MYFKNMNRSLEYCLSINSSSAINAIQIFFWHHEIFMDLIGLSGWGTCPSKGLFLNCKT